MPSARASKRRRVQQQAAPIREAPPAPESPAPRPAPRGRGKMTFLKRFVSWRRAFQLAFGVAIYLLIAKTGLSLWWVVGVGALLGVLLGKFFCRWMCPLGFMMETMLGMDPTGKQGAMYNYFKVGCPIAWAGGALNRISLFKVRRNDNPCAACARCDEACYIATHDPGYSLWRPEAKNPSEHFSCSRCLQCVGACPTGKISVGPLGTDRPPQAA